MQIDIITSTIACILNYYSIKDIYHERAWVKHDIFSVDVKLVAETRDAAHSKELKTALFDFYGSHQVAWTN